MANGRNIEKGEAPLIDNTTVELDRVANISLDSPDQIQLRYTDRYQFAYEIQGPLHE